MTKLLKQGYIHLSLKRKKPINFTLMFYSFYQHALQIHFNVPILITPQYMLYCTCITCTGYILVTYVNVKFISFTHLLPSREDNNIFCYKNYLTLFKI